MDCKDRFCIASHRIAVGSDRIGSSHAVSYLHCRSYRNSLQPAIACCLPKPSLQSLAQSRERQALRNRTFNAARHNLALMLLQIASVSQEDRVNASKEAYCPDSLSLCLVDRCLKLLTQLGVRPMTGVRAR
eukprot:19069-Heterococcus_DN1.PRE.2